MRAIYVSVPMTVSMPGLEGRRIYNIQGLKQGCPLSPTLFALYIADFEQRILQAAQRSEQLELNSNDTCNSSSGPTQQRKSRFQRNAPLALPILAGRVVPPRCFTQPTWP